MFLSIVRRCGNESVPRPVRSSDVRRPFAVEGHSNVDRNLKCLLALIGFRSTWQRMKNLGNAEGKWWCSPIAHMGR